MSFETIGGTKLPKQYPSDNPCKKCGSTEGVTYQVWESSCGGYEDYYYTCAKCGGHWWVDGIDS